MRILETLGLGREVLAVGAFLRRYEMRGWSGDLLWSRRYNGSMVVIGRGELLRILESSLSSTELHYAVRCTGYAEFDDQVRPLLVDRSGHWRSDSTFDGLIGADGIRSIVRRQLIGAREPLLRPSGWAWAGLSALDPAECPFAPGTGFLFVKQGQIFTGAVTEGRPSRHSADRRVFWWASGWGSREHGRRIMVDFRRLFPSAVVAILERSIVAPVHFLVGDRPPVSSWGRGRVTLLGDAAHPMLPAVGQGACQAMEDAMTLTRFLDQMTGIEQAFRAYESERIQKTARICRFSRAAASVLIVVPDFLRPLLVGPAMPWLLRNFLGDQDPPIRARARSSSIGAQRKNAVSRALMIYGASGFTGQLLAEKAVERGWRPLLAGRNEIKLRAVAEPLELESFTVRLEQTRRLTRALREVAVVINAAGPFTVTGRALAEACLDTGTHYLDISGELPAFQELYQQHDRAVRRNVLLLPGAGYLIVPSDCLAVQVARRLPEASSLCITFSRPHNVSRGTARTMIRHLSYPDTVCRDGKLLPIATGARRRISPLTGGCQQAVGVALPDVLTAHLSTGIPNVDVYLEVTLAQEIAMIYGRYTSQLLETLGGKDALELLSTMINVRPLGRRSLSLRHSILVEAEDPRGRRVKSILRVPESYAFTSAAALTIAEKVLNGNFTSGFRTPAQLYGPDFVLSLAGVSREDLT